MKSKYERLFRGNINGVEFHSSDEFDLVYDVMGSLEKEIGESIENHSVTELVARRVRSKFERENWKLKDFQDPVLKNKFIADVLTEDLIETVCRNLANANNY